MVIAGVCRLGGPSSRVGVPAAVLVGAALEAGHDAHARDLLAQGTHWLGEKFGDGARQAWCPWADVEGQANVRMDDAPLQDVGRRVPDAVPFPERLAHDDGGRGLSPLSSERFDEVAAGTSLCAASATLRPEVQM